MKVLGLRASSSEIRYWNNTIADAAVKLLDKEQYSIDERLLEAQIGNRLQHTDIVNIKGQM
jgi:hypothetical protein